MKIQLHVVTINPQQILPEKIIDKLSEETKVELLKNVSDPSFLPHGDAEFEKGIKDASDYDRKREIQLYVENKYNQYKRAKKKTVAVIPIIVHLPTFVKKYPTVQIYVEGPMLIDISEAKF